MKTSTLLKRLLKELKPFKLFFLIAVLAAIVSVLANLFAPLIIGNTLDKFLAHGQMKPILYALGVLAFTYMIYSFFSWVMMKSSNKIAYGSSTLLRKQLYAKMEKLPISFFDTNAHGDLISRYINDVDLISDGLLQGLSTMITGSITILFTTIIMLKLNLVMSFVVLFSAPFTFFVAKFIAKRSQNYFRKQAHILGKLNGYSEEMLDQIKMIKSYHYEEEVLQHFQDTNQDLYTMGVKSQFYGSLANPSTRFVMNVAYAIVGLVGALLTIHGDITIGSISIFLIYSNVFSKPFNEISGVITQLQSGVASARRIFSIFDRKEEREESGKEILQNCLGNISFQDVSFSYQKETPLMSHLNLEIKAGTRIAIVGKTGAGKTTLVNLLMRFYEIDQGAILMDGKKTTSYTRDSLRGAFGMVLQDTYLFEDSIANTIAYGKKEASREEIIRCAKLSGAHEFIRRLPLGYDTQITKAKDSLSQGQRQLLSITRVLLMDPAILILDEATSSIDTRSEQHVNQAMEKLMQGKTSFIIAHRLSTIVNADLILVMDHGDIIEQGQHDKLLQLQGAYAQLYNSQFE